MQYQITSDNMDVTESMKVMANEKLEKLTSKLSTKELDSGSIRLVLNKSSADDEFRVKLEAMLDGRKYFATERDFLLESALIKSVDEVVRMLQREKTSKENWDEGHERKRFVDEDSLVDNDDFSDAE